MKVLNISSVPDTEDTSIITISRAPTLNHINLDAGFSPHHIPQGIIKSRFGNRSKQNSPRDVSIPQPSIEEEMQSSIDRGFAQFENLIEKPISKSPKYQNPLPVKQYQIPLGSMPNDKEHETALKKI